MIHDTIDTWLTEYWAKVGIRELHYMSMRGAAISKYQISHSNYQKQIRNIRIDERECSEQLLEIKEFWR